MRRLGASVVTLLAVAGGLVLRVGGATEVASAAPPAAYVPASGGTISGQVVDDQGSPIAGRTVRVSGPVMQTTSTGADGTYQVTGLPDGTYRAEVDNGLGSVFSTTYDANHELLDVSSTAGQQGVDFEIARPGVVTGAITNASGRQVANAYVMGLASGYQSAGPDGTYAGKVSPGPHTVGVAAPGYVGNNGGMGPLFTQAVVIGAPGKRVRQDFTVDSGGSVSGTVTNADGTPAVGLWVYASGRTASGFYADGSAATDATGHYQINALAAASYTVAASSSVNVAVYYPGTTDYRLASPVTVVEGTTTPAIDITLLPPFTPIGPLSITSISPAVFARGTTTTAIVTGTGFVAGPNLSFGSYGMGAPPDIAVQQVLDSQHVQVTVTVPIDAALYVQPIFAMQPGQYAESAVFVIDPGTAVGTISGHVARTGDGAPLAGLVVTAVPTTGTSPFTSAAVTAGDGSYVLGPIPVGDYWVKFSASTFTGLASEYYPDSKSDLTKVAVPVVADATSPNIDASLEGATLPLISTASPGTIQPGTTTDVTVTGTGFGIDNGFMLSLPYYTYPSWAPQVVGTQVLSDTQVVLQIKTDPLTPSGPITLGVPPPNGGIINTCSCVQVAPAPATTGLATGAVTDASGTALQHVRVTATAQGQTAAAASAWTSADGRYALRLPAGSYALHVEELSGGSYDATADVALDQTVELPTVVLNTTAAYGSITGTVTDSSGVPPSQAVVEVTNVATNETSAVFTTGGSYSFPLLLAGDYLVEFDAPGFATRWYNGATDATAATPVHVTAGANTAAIDQQLPQSRRSLSIGSVQPSRVALGEVVTNAVITGSGFSIGGVTGLTFSSDTGIMISDVVVTSDTTASATLTIDPGANLGKHTISVVRDGGDSDQCGSCLRVATAVGSISGTLSLDSPPVLAMSPAVVATSQTTGESFQYTFGSAFTGGAWTLDRLPADTYIVGFSAPGFQSQWYNGAASAAAATPVVVAPGAAVTGLDATLLASRQALTLSGIMPWLLPAGSQNTVTLSGRGFLSGGVTGVSIDAGPGITVTNVVVNSDWQVTATLSVAADVPVGYRSVTVTRDDGSSWTCLSCVQIGPPVGRITGQVTGASGIASAWAYLFRVADQSPIAAATVQPDGSYSFDQLAAGDYQVEFIGYPTTPGSYPLEWWNDSPTRAGATTITIAPGATVSGIDAQLTIPSNPLTLASYFGPYAAYPGMTHSLQFYGSGFFDGVSGLAFSAGSGISIHVDSVSSDSIANVTITTDPGAALGPRDIIATRADGQTSTCLQCLLVTVPPPGSLAGYVVDAEGGNWISGTVTVTPVGAASALWSSTVFGYFCVCSVPAGDYDVLVTAAGYADYTVRITVPPGTGTTLNVPLQAVRQPLTLSATSLIVYQGYSTQAILYGTGFRSGGVTGLSFSAGGDVTVTVNNLYGDTAASVTIVAGPSAVAGTRDIVVTRDDLQTATCIGCLSVEPPAPGTAVVSLLSSETYSSVPGTVTITKVGDADPTAVLDVNGPVAETLAAGQYDVVFESPGYLSSTQRVTVVPAQTTWVYGYVDLPKQPLTITANPPQVVYVPSYYAFVQFTGSGFRAGGVTGLTVSVTGGLQVDSLVVGNDSNLYAYVTVPDTVPDGDYDVTVTRDRGDTATCTGCIHAERAPGYVNGYVTSTECCATPVATVTATRVGDTVPTATVSAVYSYNLALAPGDYIIEATAPGYEAQWWDHAGSAANATTLSVSSYGYYSVNFTLTPVRQPLSITSLVGGDVYEGQTAWVWVYGTGFLSGGVTGLAFSTSAGVDVSLNAVFSDSEALLFVTPANGAAAGPRDLTVTRDNGDSATCFGCLLVHRGEPIVTNVSPATVREGVRSITVSGDRLQRVNRVTSSDRKVHVRSFKNNKDGSVTVTTLVDGGKRRTFTLTFTRDDGVAYAVDISVRG